MVLLSTSVIKIFRPPQWNELFGFPRGVYCGLLLVFFEEDDGCILAVCGEFGDFSQGKFVSVAVGGAGNVGGVWEEGAEEVGFFVEG